MRDATPGGEGHDGFARIGARLQRGESQSHCSTTYFGYSGRAESGAGGYHGRGWVEARLLGLAARWLRYWSVPKAGLTTGSFDAMAGWVLFGFPSVAEVRFVLIHPSR